MTNENQGDWGKPGTNLHSDRETSLPDLEIEVEEFDWERLVDTVVLLISGATQNEDFSTVYILAREVEEQTSLIEDGHYASAVLRQSTFFENMLTGSIKEEFEEMTDRDLYNSEEGFIDNLGHKNRIQLAHLLGVIDERERSILLDMANWRNTVAHEWWFISERTNEKQLKDVAGTVKDLLWESVEEIVEESEEDLLTDLVEDESLEQ